MIIREINKNEFDNFSKNYKEYSYYQTSNYAILMNNYKYEIMYIGAYENNTLLAASLILYKSIAPMMKYGYAPRGFMLDYFDEKLLSEFTKKIKSFFSRKHFVFIKINPEIIYSKIDVNNKKKQVITKSKDLINCMRNLDYEKLRNNLYFESMLPKYNAVINLNKFDKNNVSNKCYIKSHSIINKSLKLKKGNLKDIKLFYEFIKEKDNKTLNYYEDFYKVYNKNNMIDLFLLEIDYLKCLSIYSNKYDELITQSEEIDKNFSKNPYDNDLYKEKMSMDKKISELTNKINILNKRIKLENKEIIGGILVVKTNNKINLFISGISNEFSNLNYKYFLYYNTINYYKKLGYSFFNLDGISGNFTEKNPYKGLNDFKLSFNPDIYEYIGEFDLVINNTQYDILWSSGKLKKEFIH